MRSGEYVSYLTRSGASKESQWAEKELAAGPVVKGIISRGMDKSVFGAGRLLRLVGLWFAGSAVLVQALFMLAAGGIGRSLGNARGGSAIAGIIVLLGIIALVVCGIGLSRHTVALSSGAGAALALEGEQSWGVPVAFVGALTIGSVLAIPIVAVIVMTVVSLVQSASFASVLGRGGLAVGLLLVGIYAIIAIALGSMEATAQTEVAEMTKLEGPYFARLLGEKWPS